MKAIEQPGVSLGFLGLSWALLRSPSPGLSWVLLDSPGLPGLLGLPGLSWALLGYPGLSWALLGSPGLSWALLGCLGSPALFWALLGSPEGKLEPERARSVSEVGLRDRYAGTPEPERARSPCGKTETCARACSQCGKAGT
jgi:hypothetical protein